MYSRFPKKNTPYRCSTFPLHTELWKRMWASRCGSNNFEVIIFVTKMQTNSFVHISNQSQYNQVSAYKTWREHIKKERHNYYKPFTSNKTTIWKELQWACFQKQAYGIQTVFDKIIADLSHWHLAGRNKSIGLIDRLTKSRNLTFPAYRQRM